MADQLRAIRRDDDVPAGVRGCDEVGDRVVQFADQPAHPGQFGRFHRGQFHRRPAGDVLQHVPTLGIATQGPGGRREAGRRQVLQQGLDRGGGRGGRFTHGVTGPDHLGGHVPAGQDLFGGIGGIRGARHCLILPGGPAWGGRQRTPGAWLRNPGGVP